MAAGSARKKAGIALVLGGGGARGLAHIPMLEVFDELGVRPVALAGTSMGAIFAAIYASGLSGKDIREFVTAILADRRGLFGRLMEARSGRLSDLFSGLGNPVMIDAEAFCSLFLPGQLAQTFGDCSIPLTISATDFYARREVVFREGPLRPAVAASIAIPGLIRPVMHGESVLIDGGAVNPLPLDHLAGMAAAVVAIDVTGGPSRAPTASPDTPPGPWDAMFGTVQILQATIVAEKLIRFPPDILIRPNVDLFRVLDFQQASVIFRLAVPARDELKRALAALLERL
jgi:NTE family protein